jgi:hypothetical protein
MNQNPTSRWTAHVFVPDETNIPEAIATYTQGRNTFVHKHDVRQTRLCHAATAAKELADKLNKEGRVPSATADTILDLPKGTFPTQQDIDADLVEFTRDGTISTVAPIQPKKIRRPAPPVDR